MSIETKQQEIIDEFEVYDDWIRESTAFDRRRQMRSKHQALAQG